MSDTKISATKVWLITGSTRGLGRALAEAVLAAGHNLVATGRNPAHLKDLVARYPQSKYADDASAHHDHLICIECGAIAEFEEPRIEVLQESIAGVRDVRAGNFTGGKAQFDLSFVGTTDDLASKVGGKTFKSRKINVTGVTGNTLELTLAK